VTVPAPARYTVAGISDEHNTCDCCGKSNLKSTVVLLDLDSGEFVFFGCVCASRNTGKSDTASVARKRGRVSSPAAVLAEHYRRQESSLNQQARSILKMANGCANEETRAEARRYFDAALEARKKGDEARAQALLERRQS
jgi:hypothetical protein